MKEVKLTRGKIAIVDDSDFDWISQYKWWAWTNGSNWYAVRYQKRRYIAMHRVLMDFPKGFQVDHINGNGLDNRRQNLRICTHSSNACNRTKTIKNTAGYKGVTLRKEFVRRGYQKAWVAKIGLAGKKYWLGAFLTPEEAAHAYDEAALKLHGEYAVLNFPKARSA